MKCPKCGKDVELQKRQVGLDDNGEPIMNEFAICRDCKKKWNLDKQRQKKSAAKAEAKAASEVTAEPKAAAEPEVVVEPKAVAEPEVAVEPEVVMEPETARRPGADEVPSGATKVIDSKEVAALERPARKPRKNPSERPASERPRKRPVSTEEEERLGNIPSESVRKKREAAVKKNYEEMLAADSRPAKKKRPADEAKPAAKPAPKPITRMPEPEPEEDEYEATPRFKVFRILLGILSIAGGAYFGVRAVMTGFDGFLSGGQLTPGAAYLVLAACILVSGLLTIILKNCMNRIAFVIPFLLCAAGGVAAFLFKQDDQWLLYGAIAGVVLAAIYLLLTILGACKEDDDDDWDDDDDDYDDEDDEDDDY